MRDNTTLSRLVLMSIAVACVLNVAVGQEAAEDQNAAPAAPKVHVVAEGDLVLRFEREGRIDSSGKSKVRVAPEEYRGTLEVTQVVKRSGPVAAGEKILVFETRYLDEQLSKARESLYDAKQRLDLVRNEREIMLEANALRIEKAERAKIAADHELEIWGKFNSERMLKSSDLGVQQREYSLADQKEELSQLEAMYEGTRLDSDTKDIVLERARRGVGVAEQWLGIIRNDARITRTFRHPDRDKQVRQDARHRDVELDHARANGGFAELRKELEFVSAQRKVREAEKLLAGLEADFEKLVVTAPTAGEMTKYDLMPGDTVGGRQVITQIVNLSDLVVNFSAVAEDLRIVTEGANVELSLPAFPEVDLTGRVSELSTIGESGGGSTTFDGVASLVGSSDLIRIGLRCVVSAERTLTGIMLIPKNSIREKDGETVCSILINGEPVDREIRIGASNDELVQVISGLAVGDEVVLEGNED